MRRTRRRRPLTADRQSLQSIRLGPQMAPPRRLLCGGDEEIPQSGCGRSLAVRFPGVGGALNHASGHWAKREREASRFPTRRRRLVVANRTADSYDLLDALAARASRSPARFPLVCPPRRTLAGRPTSSGLGRVQRASCAPPRCACAAPGLELGRRFASARPTASRGPSGAVNFVSRYDEFIVLHAAATRLRLAAAVPALPRRRATCLPVAHVFAQPRRGALPAARARQSSCSGLVAAGPRPPRRFRRRRRDGAGRRRRSAAAGHGPGGSGMAAGTRRASGPAGRGDRHDVGVREPPGCADSGRSACASGSRAARTGRRRARARAPVALGPRTVRGGGRGLGARRARSCGHCACVSPGGRPLATRSECGSSGVTVRWIGTSAMRSRQIGRGGPETLTDAGAMPNRHSDRAERDDGAHDESPRQPRRIPFFSRSTPAYPPPSCTPERRAWAHPRRLVKTRPRAFQRDRRPGAAARPVLPTAPRPSIVAPARRDGQPEPGAAYRVPCPRAPSSEALEYVGHSSSASRAIVEDPMAARRDADVTVLTGGASRPRSR